MREGGREGGREKGEKKGGKAIGNGAKGSIRNGDRWTNG